jgi:hypothetical protein
LAVLFIASFAPISAVNAQTITPSKTLVENYSQTSSDGGFFVTVNVYQYADLDPQKDYYFLEVSLQCPQRNFNHAIANVSIDGSDELMTISWLPHSNPASPFAVGLGIATLYVGNAETVQVDCTQKAQLSWTESTLNPKNADVFSTDLWLPQDATVNVTLYVEAGFRDKIFGDLWMDKLVSGVIDVEV